MNYNVSFEKLISQIESSELDRIIKRNMARVSDIDETNMFLVNGYITLDLIQHYNKWLEQQFSKALNRSNR